MLFASFIWSEGHQLNYALYSNHHRSVAESRHPAGALCSVEGRLDRMLLTIRIELPPRLSPSLNLCVLLLVPESLEEDLLSNYMAEVVLLHQQSSTPMRSRFLSSDPTFSF